MSIKVAINGFGRIGRLALRQILKTDGIEVVAVNDLTPPDMLVHLFKYDTTQGRFQGEVELKDDGMVVNGKAVKMFANANPEELPWGELGIDVVLEETMGTLQRMASTKGMPKPSKKGTKTKPDAAPITIFSRSMFSLPVKTTSFLNAMDL